MPNDPPTLPDDDEALLADLRRVVARVDPIPQAAQIAARAALDWRTIDAELAQLVEDSAVDEPALTVRGAATVRSLAFEADGLAIEIEAEPLADGTLRIAGQLIPPQPGEIAISHGSAIFAVRADDRGCFAADGVAPGPVRLRCRLDGEAGEGRLVETAWLTI